MTTLRHKGALVSIPTAKKLASHQDPLPEWLLSPLLSTAPQLHFNPSDHHPPLGCLLLFSADLPVLAHSYFILHWISREIFIKWTKPVLCLRPGTQSHKEDFLLLWLPSPVCNSFVVTSVCPVIRSWMHSSLLSLLLALPLSQRLWTYVSSVLALSSLAHYMNSFSCFRSQISDPSSEIFPFTFISQCQLCHSPSDHFSVPSAYVTIYQCLIQLFT